MTVEDARRYYADNYDILRHWDLRSGSNIWLGSKGDACRFCGRNGPEVTFKKIAHAIPESLGNKSLRSHYECDECNHRFGTTIENDLGNWSKPMRTFARIRGSSGIPAMKGGGPQGWRIAYEDGQLNVTSYETDPMFTVDEENATVTFKLRRDPYTPVGVMKAFAKIGLTLMPQAELANFGDLKAFVCDRDHTRQFLLQSPLFYTFTPGPMPNDELTATLLKRKPDVKGVPYAFLVLAYGNEAFQTMLPSQQQDPASSDVKMFPFILPQKIDPARYGPPRRARLHLEGRDVVKGDEAIYTLGGGSIIRIK
jgi:hypothetical protein